jgi:hypothetical protein
MRRRLSVETRRELIEAVGERYRAAGRVEKKQILDEFAEIAGYHRKYAIRVLRGASRNADVTRSRSRRKKGICITGKTGKSGDRREGDGWVRSSEEAG